MVPMRPTFAPVTCSSTPCISITTELLPLVPVTPTMVSFSAGRPYQLAAIWARASRAEGTTT